MTQSNLGFPLKDMQEAEKLAMSKGRHGMIRHDKESERRAEEEMMLNVIGSTTPFGGPGKIHRAIKKTLSTKKGDLSKAVKNAIANPMGYVSESEQAAYKAKVMARKKKTEKAPQKTDYRDEIAKIMGTKAEDVAPTAPLYKIQHKEGAELWDSFYEINKGEFWRGESTTGAGVGLGALGKGIYISDKKGMAEFFAGQSKGGVVNKYKIKPGLKLIDSLDPKVAKIKEEMGFKSWEYSDSPMYSTYLTNKLKKLGYDGVVSAKPAEGMVIFNKKNVELIKQPKGLKDIINNERGGFVPGAEIGRAPKEINIPKLEKLEKLYAGPRSGMQTKKAGMTKWTKEKMKKIVDASDKRNREFYENRRMVRGTTYDDTSNRTIAGTIKGDDIGVLDQPHGVMLNTERIRKSMPQHLKDHEYDLRVDREEAIRRNRRNRR